MHELSIAHEILRIVEEQISPEAHAQVRCVRLRIGTLTSVLPESLTFCFDALVDHTSFRSARLEIEHVPLTLSCSSCGNVFTPEGWASCCPECESTSLKTIAGQELDVRSIELAENPSEVA